MMLFADFPTATCGTGVLDNILASSGQIERSAVAACLGATFPEHPSGERAFRRKFVSAGSRRSFQ